MSQLLSCASTRRYVNRKPTKILGCRELGQNMKARRDILQRVEGKALIRDKSNRIQVLMSLRADRQFWIEIRSPLGGPFAVLRADQDWVEFFIPRRKELYRIPASEFWKASPRQRKFLQLLPVAFRPEEMLDLIIGRLDPAQMQSCQWSERDEAYVVMLKFEDGSRHQYKVDGISFFPIQSGTDRGEFTMKLVPGSYYPTESLEFGSKFELFRNVARGDSTDPKPVLELTFEWIELNWRAQLGEKPPFFPESLNVKQFNY